MAAPLKTTIPILQGLAEALEDTSTKIRRARDELKELRAEAREAKKAGTEVSATSQQRMSTLQEQIQQLKYQQVAERIAKQGRTRGISDALGSAQGIIGQGMRLGSGNVGLMDVGNLGSLMQRAGTGIISSGRLGGTGARIGAQLARAGTGIASGAAAALPFVGAALAGYGIARSIGGLGQDYYARQQANADSRSAIEDQIAQLQRPAAYGGRMAFDDVTMQRIREGSIKSQQPIEASMVGSSLYERLRRGILGADYMPSRAIDAATTDAANRDIRLRMATVQDGRLRSMADNIESSSAFQTALRLRINGSMSRAGRWFTNLGNKSTLGGRLISALDTDDENYFTSNYNLIREQVKQEEIDRIIRTEEAQRKREEFLMQNPNYRIAAQETDRTIQRVEADRMRRHLDWNQI